MTSGASDVDQLLRSTAFPLLPCYPQKTTLEEETKERLCCPLEKKAAAPAMEDYNLCWQQVACEEVKGRGLPAAWKVASRE